MRFSSLLLATADENGLPNASYAVYVNDDQGCYYIYISELARHTRNLQINPKASVLFVEDENQCSNLFARRRLTCICRVESIRRDSPVWHEILGMFTEKHGSFIDLLQQLQDFHLFRLIPETALYVKGFAQAYPLGGSPWQDIRLKNDTGHRKIQVL